MNPNGLGPAPSSDNEASTSTRCRIALEESVQAYCVREDLTEARREREDISSHESDTENRSRSCRDHSEDANYKSHHKHHKSKKAKRKHRRRHHHSSPFIHNRERDTDAGTSQAFVNKDLEDRSHRSEDSLQSGHRPNENDSEDNCFRLPDSSAGTSQRIVQSELEKLPQTKPQSGEVQIEENSLFCIRRPTLPPISIPLPISLRNNESYCLENLDLWSAPSSESGNIIPRLPVPNYTGRSEESIRQSIVWNNRLYLTIDSAIQRLETLGPSLIQQQQYLEKRKALLDQQEENLKSAFQQNLIDEEPPETTENVRDIFRNVSDAIIATIMNGNSTGTHATPSENVGSFVPSDARLQTSPVTTSSEYEEEEGSKDSEDGTETLVGDELQCFLKHICPATFKHPGYGSRTRHLRDVHKKDAMRCPKLTTKDQQADCLSKKFYQKIHLAQHYRSCHKGETVPKFEFPPYKGNTRKKSRKAKKTVKKQFFPPSKK